MKPGDTFTKTFDISAEVFAVFLNVFKNKNPLYVNTEFAQEHGFKGILVQGNAMCGFLSHFVGECLPIKNVIIQKQNVQFLKPVYLGDKVTLTAFITDYFDTVDAFEFKYWFINQNGEKVCKGTLLVGCLKYI